MRSLALVGLALVISLSTAASAAPVLLGTTTDPTGIDGLVVDGTTYDVTFNITTLNTFTMGSTVSVEAASDLASALNGFGVTELGGKGPQSGGFYLDVDNSLASFDMAFCSSGGSPCTVGSWTGTTASGLALGETDDPASGGQLLFVQAADFTATSTAVPEPLTLSLFGFGLAGVGVMRRRKKAA